MAAALPAWNCISSAVHPSERISFQPAGVRRRRPEVYWQYFWDKNGSSQHPDFQHRGTKGSLWSNKRRNAVLVKCDVVSLNARQPSDLGSAHGSAFVATSSLRDIVQLCEEGQLEEALDVFLRPDQRSTAPRLSVYRFLLKECTKRKALLHAKRVSTHLAEQGLESTGFLGDSVVKTLVKCGSLPEALQVFHRLPWRTVVSWTAVISGYTEAGQGRKALRMYRCMQQEGVQPNSYTFVSLLQACGSLSDLEAGRFIHVDALACNYGSDLFVGTCLIDMYAKCGSLLDAQLAFDGLFERNVVSWTAILTAYAQQGQPEKGLELYARMLEEGMSPNFRTYVSTLQAIAMCTDKESNVLLDGQWLKLKSLEQTRAVHTAVLRKGFCYDVFVGTTLISTYGKCGSITDAQNIFAELQDRDVVPWNSMLSAYIHLEQVDEAFQLYDLMLTQCVDPDERTYVSVLQACGMLAERDEALAVRSRISQVELLKRGKTIHAHAHWAGCNSEAFVGSALIATYGKCGSVSDAWHVFDGLSQPNVVSWNSMLTVYVQQGAGESALHLYIQMLEAGVSPNEGTFVCALQAAAMIAEMDDRLANLGATKVKSLQIVKAVHADVQKFRPISDVRVASILVSVYGRCGSMLDAREVFNRLSNRDAVSWNVMLAAYVQQDQPMAALQLYEQMQREAMSPDDRTFVCVIQACGLLAGKELLVDGHGESCSTKCLERGRLLHADARRKGYGSDVFVGNSLITMYGRCGSILDAQNVFDGLPQHDVVSWTAILAVHAQQGKSEEALQLYKRMKMEGVRPNEITMVCMLQASSSTGLLDVCREIHHTLLSDGTVLGHLAVTTLIHAYGRCASMLDARAVFDTLPQPDVMPWTALIAGYARQGNCLAGFQCYKEMLQVGTQPDEATFLSLLSACSHAGFIEKGMEFFESMSRDHGISPQVEHYVGMVDILARAGLFTRVTDLLSTMPMQPNLAIWLCLLAACQKSGNVVLGRQAFDCAVTLQPKDGAAYVLMSNIYTDAGMVRIAKEIDQWRQEAGARKKSGQSWIRHQQETHTFLAGESNHLQLNHLYNLLADAN